MIHIDCKIRISANKHILLMKRGSGKDAGMGTNEYFSGNRELAAQLGCMTDSQNHGIVYRLPPKIRDNWLVDVHPKPGLILSNVYFTLPQPVIRVYDIEQPGLWLCSFARGDVTILERGKKSKRLQPGIHLLVNQGQPFKITFGSSEPIWYTAAWIFSDFIAKYLKDREWEEPLTLGDALSWPNHYYNTPELVMLFEQLKYGIRNTDKPLMYFEVKIMEILSTILSSVQLEGYSEKFFQAERPKYVTYQNKKFLWQVKTEIDKDILVSPSVKQLAVIAEMGTTKLRQLFKSYYGVTIDGYVRQEKMNYALRLLSHDDMSVQNISTFLGYGCPSRFTAAFKKIHGFTPQQFRKSLSL